AAGALDHMPDNRLKRMKDTVQIDGKHLSPLLRRSIDERRAPAAPDACIREAAIDATEMLQRPLGRPLGLLAIRDVASNRHHAPAPRLDRSHGLSVFLFIAPPDRYRASFCCKRLRDRKADATI